MKILIVEDDYPQASLLSHILKTHNFSVDITSDGQEAFNYLEIFPYDLIILDVLLPRIGGLSLCRKLRQAGYKTPILLLTVKKSLKDKVDGLSAGADDYLVKPFEPEELLARIQSLLRRSHIPITSNLRWGNLELQPNSSQVTYNGSHLKLTPTEYRFLELFLRHPLQLFSIAQITDYQCDADHSYSVAAVRSHIKGLRYKLKQAGVPDLIETVYGLGYRLKELPSGSPPQAIDTVVESRTKRGQKNLEFLATSWEKFLPKIIEQLDLIQHVAEQMREGGRCHDDVQQKIQQEAHQLTGLLGMFGFLEASKSCAKIEALIKTNPQLHPDQALQLSRLAASVRQTLDAPMPLDARSLPQVTDAPVLNKRRPYLLIVDKKTEFTQKLKEESEYCDFEAIAVSSLVTTREQIQQRPPDIMVIDLDSLSDREASLSLLLELKQSFPSILILVLTVDGSFTSRLEISRLKVHAFLQKPIDPRQVMAEVKLALHQAHLAEAQILIVDDHPQMQKLLKHILEPHGLHLISLEDSRLLWDTLEIVTPDLVIMDVKMPHVNGIELCQVVRNDPRWHDVPILVLTAFGDTDTIQQVLAAGADDVVSKNITQPELVARVMTRLKRSLFHYKSSPANAV